MSNVISLRRIPTRQYLMQHPEGVLGAIVEQNAKFPHLMQRLVAHAEMLHKHDIPQKLQELLATPGPETKNNLHVYAINLDIQRCDRKISSFDFFLAKAFIHAYRGEYKDALQNFFNVQWLLQCGVKKMISPKEYRFGQTKKAMQFHVAHVEAEETIIQRTLQTMREIMADLEKL